MTDRPNFLYLITDQQRADWLGCYGHPVLKTPHIDSIAARGTRFENFHVAAPVCMPNRASLVTGRYPSVHGLRYNGCRLPLSANTFVNQLAKAGYHTAAIGKSHLQPFTGLPPMGKSTEEINRMPEAWQRVDGDYNQEEPASYSGKERFALTLPYYGYQHVDTVTAHGDRCKGHYGQWFREQTTDWQALHDNANQLKHNYSCPQAYRTPIPEELYPTAYVKDRAIEYLNNRKLEADPFFAFVSFPDPHHPFNPPGKYWDMYSPDDFEVRLPLSAHKNPTPPMRALEEQWKSDASAPTPQTARMLDEQALKEAMALTAGMMAFVDDAVGEILQALESNGQLDNTVICYNSDHGDYLGDYNMLLKAALPFKSVTKVPFLWFDPADDRTGRVTSAMASTVDIAPTILARAGVESYHGMQGIAFNEVLSGGQASREDLLIEHNDGGARLGFTEPARMRAVVSQKWRYTMYLDQDWGELYDLENDPDESHNLWDVEEYKTVRAELSERLNHHLTRQMDESPRANRIA